MEKKAHVPKKGAGRKWAKRLEELGQQKPPSDLIDKINEEARKKVAAPRQAPKDLDA